MVPVEVIDPMIAVRLVLPADWILPLTLRLRLADAMTSAPPTMAPVRLRSCPADSVIAEPAWTSCSVAAPVEVTCTEPPRSEPVKFVSPPDCSVVARPNAVSPPPLIAPPATRLPLPCPASVPPSEISFPAVSAVFPSAEVDFAPSPIDWAASTVRLPPAWMSPELASEPVRVLNSTSPLD